MLPRSMSVGFRSSQFASRLIRAEFDSISHAFKPFAKKDSVKSRWATNVLFGAQGFYGNRSSYPLPSGERVTWHLIAKTRGKKYPLAFSMMLPRCGVSPSLMECKATKPFSSRSGRLLFFTYFIDCSNEAASSDRVKLQEILPSGSILAARFTPAPVHPTASKTLYEKWLTSPINDMKFSGDITDTPDWLEEAILGFDIIAMETIHVDDVFRAPLQPQQWSERTWKIFRQLEATV